MIAWQRERSEEKYACELVEVKVRPHLFKGFIHKWIERQPSAVELDAMERERELAAS